MTTLTRTPGQNPMLPGAVRAGGLVHTSGIVSPSAMAALGTTETVPGAQQTAEAFDELVRVLADAGAGPEDVVKLDVFLASRTMFDVLNARFRTVWPEPGPARTTLVAELVDPSILVELQAVAVVP